MSRFYNLEDIKKDLAKELELAKAFKQAWEAVTYPTKKDGTPFANMTKNIQGAKYGLEPLALQSGEYQLTLTVRTDKAGYRNDAIPAYELVKYLTKEEQIAKTQNYMPEQHYLERVYRYDLDDIKAAVKERIDYYAMRIVSLKKQLERADSAYNSFKAAYADAMKKLEATCATDDPAFTGSKNDLFYAVKETVVERYPYC